VTIVLTAADGAKDASQDDDALLLRVAQRDREAFATLFGRYAGRIKAFLMRAGFPAAEADEGAQEVMLAIWRRAATFDPVRAGAATWIFAVARNRRVDMLRRRRPEPDPADPQFRPDPLDPADRLAERAARDSAVRAALADLPSEQRALVRLAFYEGLTHSEAAQAMELPLGTVKSRLRLAMGRMRGALGEAFAQELLDD
jgi:RNA polymerase sigma-70 factor (ECF subfamily)